MSSRPSAAGGSGRSCVSDQTFYVCKGLDLERSAQAALVYIAPYLEGL